MDEVVDPRALRASAIKAAQELASGELKPHVTRATKGIVNKTLKHLLEGTSLGRGFVFKKAREMVMKTTYGNYPAPLKVPSGEGRGGEGGGGGGGGGGEGYKYPGTNINTAELI